MQGMVMYMVILEACKGAWKYARNELSVYHVRSRLRDAIEKMLVATNLSS